MTAAEIRALVRGMTDRELDDVIDGRVRLAPGGSDLDRAIWNAAIDEENDR